MNKYNANVRIDNWYYDLILQEEKTKQYMRRSKNAELKVQKTRQLFLSMLKEVPLTFPVVGLSYGAVIQIVSPEMPPRLVFKIHQGAGIFLGADINYKNTDQRSTFAHGDPVIGTGLATPCVRNVWTLVPYDKTKEGKELRFGDSFYIKLFSSDPPLYVDCPQNKPGVPKGECGNVVPSLINRVSTTSRFKVVKNNPRVRFETEGMVVPPNENVAILQAATSECLAVEPDSWFPTFFGMECEVSVHTHKEIKDPKKPDPRNFWRFILSAS